MVGSTFDVHPHHLSAQGGVPLLRDGRCSMGYLFGPMFILAASTLIAFSIAFTAPVFRVCLVEDGSRACFFDDDTADVSSESRRGLITSGVTFSSPLLYCINPEYAEEEGYYIRISTSPMIIARFIHDFCNTKYLSSVRRSRYNFMYRGLLLDESQAVTYSNQLAAIVIKEEPFDLLDSDTYNSIESVEYFQSLEDEMTAMRMPLKPSNSHIGTTNPIDAARWGKAASIWPLGESGVDFAWPEVGGLFWPIRGGKRNIQERSNVITSSAKVTGDGECDGLSEALRGDTEIMFRADNGFVAVPAELDKELREYLTYMQM